MASSFTDCIALGKSACYPDQVGYRGALDPVGTAMDYATPYRKLATGLCPCGFRLASCTIVHCRSIRRLLDCAIGLGPHCARQATVSDGAHRTLGPCTIDRCLERFCAAPAVQLAAELLTPNYVCVKQRVSSDTLAGPQWWLQVTAHCQVSLTSCKGGFRR